MQLLAKIATIAAAQPNPPVRDSQFWYIKSWVSNQVCNGGSGANCVVEKPHERQIWQSVSNQCVTGLLREAIAPPRVSAALYRAAALIPGVTVVPDATDAIGRHGVAVAMTYQGVQSEWIFSKQTLQYLGERDIDIANGSTIGEAAALQRAFVDHPGQLPG